MGLGRSTRPCTPCCHGIPQKEPNKNIVQVGISGSRGNGNGKKLPSEDGVCHGLPCKDEIDISPKSLCEFPLKNRTTRVVLKNEISMKSRVERTTVKVGVEILYRWVGGP